VEEVFKSIRDSTQKGNVPMNGKIKKMAQAMQAYRSRIIEFKNLLASPSTPKEVRT
jgi:hypothetical protein